MNALLTRPKVLVLRTTSSGGPGAPETSLDESRDGMPDLGREEALREALAESCDTVSVNGLAEALRRIRREGFDAVLVNPEMLRGPEREGLAGRLVLMLDRIGEGVCLLDDAGGLLWTNRRFREWGPALADKVREGTRSAACTLSREDSCPREVRFTIQTADDRSFSVLANPIIDPVESGPRVLAIISDQTDAERLRRKIDAIDIAGRELMRFERDAVAKLDVPQRLDLLEEKIRSAAHQLLNFDHFNIRLLDRKTDRIVPVVSTGLPDSAEIELFAKPEGNGISGWVASTGKSYICNDAKTDSKYLPGLDQARSSLTVPLMLKDEVVGVFNVESRDPSRFGEQDRRLAEIFGRYVAGALHMLDLLVVERYRTTGLMAEDLAQEIAGPLNDIITDSAALLDDVEDEGLKSRLRDILGNVDAIRASLRQVGVASGGLLGVAGCDKTVHIDPELDGRRILVADDECTIRETIGDVLAGHGCVVEQAADGAEATRMLAECGYDLVLSDIRMPHRNGYEVFSSAKEKRADLPVILMTGFGYDPAHSVVRARRDGLSAVLYKPFKVHDMMTEVRSALKAAATATANPEGAAASAPAAEAPMEAPVPATAGSEL